MIKIKLIEANQVYNRIKSGLYFSEDLKTYTELEIDSCIRQFIEDEEYEKCVYLRNFKEFRFNHEIGFYKPVTFSEWL